jgi:hypothetical protein
MRALLLVLSCLLFDGSVELMLLPRSLYKAYQEATGKEHHHHQKQGDPKALEHARREEFRSEPSSC